MIKRVLLWTMSLALTIGLAVSGYIGLTLWRAHGGVPAWDGSFEVTGLDGSVEILRDANGVPHLYASSERDALFAQGFVHAQDRLWQMALNRQTLSGRLSEWLGPLALRGDRINRILGYSEMAERLWAQFPADERELLEAYAAGVNAWLESPAFRRPPEMIILHVRPERWRPEDSFIIYRGVHQVLSGYGQEPASARYALLADHADALDMIDTDDQQVRTIIPAVDGASIQPALPGKERGFSNSWLVSGAHTAGGLPLLANDPQLPATMPNLWYLVHSSVSGRSVVGAGLPGVPGVGIGHNGRIAWGVTNAMIDVNDIALIEIHPEDEGRFRRGPGEPWQAFRIRSEEIRVRFGRDHTETVRVTPDGLLLPRQLLSSPLTDLAHAEAEFRIHGLDYDTSIAAFLRLNRAEDVAGAIDALGAFSGPPLNFSIADIDGRIGYLAAARIPDRPVAHATTVGLWPEDGNARSYLPPEANPRLIDPAAGRIVTANQRIVGDEYPHYLSDRWEPGDRAWRIHELLDQRSVHDLDSYQAMQNDRLSPVARRLVPLFLAVEPADPADQALVDLLASWDFRFDPDSSAPTVFLTWYEMLVRAIVEPRIGPRLPTFRSFHYGNVEAALAGERPEWCQVASDDPRDCPALLALTLNQARMLLEQDLGVDPADWRWEFAGRLHMPHLGFAGLPLLDGWFSRLTPFPGGPESMFTNSIDASTAPIFHRSSFNSSIQTLYDLADLERARFAMAGGQSGHFRSLFYDNLTAGLIQGERFEIPVDPALIEPTGRILLRPVAQAPD